jgi:hypothetical protein
LIVDLFGRLDLGGPVPAHRVVRIGEVRRAQFGELEVAEPRNQEPVDAVAVVRRRAVAHLAALDPRVEPPGQLLGERHLRVGRPRALLELAQRLGSGLDGLARRGEAALDVALPVAVGAGR